VLQDDRCLSIQGGGTNYLIELSTSNERDLLSSKLKQIATTINRIPEAVPTSRKAEGKAMVWSSSCVACSFCGGSM
jgi:hypothetical protein